MAELAPSALDRRLHDGSDGPLVIDIRPPDEFADWHVPGSENVPVYETLKDGRETEAADALAALPDDREVVTVCAAGKLSAVATDVLRDLGYDATTLRDGMDGWSRVHRTATVDAAIDGTLVQVARPGTGCLSHVLVSDGEAAIFDPSQYGEEYEAVLDANGADLVGVFDSHAHADHVSGGPDLAARHDVPYSLHPADAVDRDDTTSIEAGDTITVGDVETEVLHTPGHSPGSVTFAVGDDVLLTGDTLFHDTVGRVELGIAADLEDASVADNAAKLYEGLQRLRERDGDPLVLPAHDPGTPEPPVTARMSHLQGRNEDLTRDRESFVEALADDVPEQPPNFQRIKRVNAGTEVVDPDERATLEAGPNNCAAE